MKGTIILKMFMVIALFFLSSCKEYFITTKVNSDGTVERNVACKIYQDQVNKKVNFPETFLADSVWTIKTVRDTVNKRDLITADIKFNSFEEAIKELNKPRRNFDPVVDIKIEKQFKFFFTYYTYKESYKPFNQFKKTPLDKYFSQQEIIKLKEGTDSLWVETRLEEYSNYNLIDMFLDDVEKVFLSKYEIKFSNLISSEKRKQLIAEILPTIKDDKDYQKFKTVIDKYFDKISAERIVERIDKNNEMVKMWEAMSRHDGKYENAVIMPGIITASNSKAIEGNKVSWKFDQENFKFFDYEMSAESREVNTWFIIVSGIIVLLLITLLILPKFRKKAAF